MKKILCPKCGYTWDTKSEMIYVQCPSCRASIKVKNLPECRRNNE